MKERIRSTLGAIKLELACEWRTVLLLALPPLLLLLLLDLRHTSIGFLQLYSIDDYVFHGSLRHMLTGLTGGDITNLFGYGFYQYGFGYFFLNLLAALPGLLFDQTHIALFGPRAISSLFAVGSLVVVYKFSRLYLSWLPSVLFSFLLVTMPAFWFNATWFHPDWVMSFFLLAFIYCLARDDWKFGGYFAAAVVMYGLAVATKYQAVTALPLLGLYVFYDTIRLISFEQFTQKLLLFSKSLIAIVSLFVLANPYILHPIGWKVWSSALMTNMASNATNHGAAAPATLNDKLQLAISDYYMNEVFFVILLLAALWLVYQYMIGIRERVFPVIAINFLVNLVYLLLFVNKAWQIYYLPVITVGLLILVYFVSRLKVGRQSMVLLAVAAAQVLFYGASYQPILSVSRDHTNPDFNTYTPAENERINEFIIESLRGSVSPEEKVLITPYTPFDYEELGLPYEHIRVIFGALARENFDKEAYLQSQKTVWGDIKHDDEILGSFNQIDYIVLRKDIPFIDVDRLEDVRDQAPYLEAAGIVEELYAGSLGYEVLVEDQYVVIFQVIN